MLERLIRAVAPQLLDAFGIAADTAAEKLVVAGDNPERMRTEAAWAKLLWGRSDPCVVGNDPASAEPRR
jgi:hypothetical protein